MRLACPKCNDAMLVRGRAGEVGGPPRPLRCGACGGMWLSIGELEWLRAAAPAIKDDVEPPDGESQDRRGGGCPHGHGRLERARVDVDRPFYLERCVACGGVFFDAGEWGRLAGTWLIAHLDALWDPAFQKRLADERAERAHRARLREALGDEGFAQLERLAALLRGHPAAGQAFAFLAAEVHGHKPAPLSVARPTRKVAGVDDAHPEGDDEGDVDSARDTMSPTRSFDE